VAGQSQTVDGSRHAFLLTLDAVPPTTTAALAPAPNAAGWNHSNITVTLSAADNTGGSGVRSISYYATGAQTIGSAASPVTVTASAGTSGSFSTPVDLDTEGLTDLSFFATDNAGNVEGVQSVSVRLDRTAPTVSFGTPSPAPNEWGWNNTDVTVPFTPGDNLSGIDSCSPATSPLVLTGEGAAVAGPVTVTDKAGNSATLTTPACKIDRTPPTVTYSGNAGTYTVDQMVSIACGSSDDLSGVATCTGHDIVGPAYTFSLGTNSFSATATDKAGNAGSASTSFTVQVTCESLASLTRQFVQKPHLAHSLCEKLEHAAAVAARGDSDAREDQLAAYRAYVNEVRAHSGKALTAEQAEILIQLAEAL
jgi:hypothetical protein